MKTTQTILLVFTLNLVLLVGFTYAQEAKGRFLYVGLGIQNHKEVDQIISSLKYQNTGVPVLFSYSWNKENHKHSIFGEFYSFELNSVTENKRSADFLSFGYSYLQKLYTFSVLGRSIRIAGGAEWANKIYLSQQQFVNFGVSLNNSGFFSSNIDVLFDFNLELNSRHRLLYAISTPVIQYIVRPGFSLFRPNENSDSIFGNLKEGTFEYFLYGIRIEQQARYLYQLSRRIYLTTSYIYNINEMPDPRIFRLIQKGLTFGTIIKL